MVAYIVRRFFLSIFILFGVSVVLYALIRSMPGDFVSNATAGNKMVTPEMRDALRGLYGLDVSIFEGYIRWVGNALQGNLGMSFKFDMSVAQVIRNKMWHSFTLSAIAMVLQLLIAIPLGIVSATKQYSRTDYAVTVAALIGISLPSFFFAAVLQRIFAIQLGWVPIAGMIDPRMNYEGFELVLDKLHHLILPIIVLTVISVGGLMRYSRTNMLEVLNADYIRTARAKGLSERVVIYRHAFRNTLIPIVTMVGGMLPGLFSGAIITESIFSLDGLGNTLYQCIQAGDIPYVMAFCMFLSILTLVGTLISDLLYAVVDPRVRLS